MGYCVIAHNLVKQLIKMIKEKNYLSQFVAVVVGRRLYLNLQKVTLKERKKKRKTNQTPLLYLANKGIILNCFV